MFRRYTQLLSGLLAYGIAIAMIVRGEIGIAPWDVLAQGISFKTNLDFGLITVLIGAVVLLLWIPLREKPGIGTVLNVLLVGPAASLGLFLIPPGLDLWVRILLFAGGIVLMGLATGLYIGARFGTGPRDGLMTGVSRRTGWRIWIVRSGIEPGCTSHCRPMRGCPRATPSPSPRSTPRPGNLRAPPVPAHATSGVRATANPSPLFERRRCVPEGARPCRGAGDGWVVEFSGTPKTRMLTWRRSQR